MKKQLISALVACSAVACLVIVLSGCASTLSSGEVPQLPPEKMGSPLDNLDPASKSGFL